MNTSMYFQRLPEPDEIIKRQPDYFDQVVTAKEAAAILDTTTTALAQMRSRGTGPDYIRLPTITTKDKRGRPRGPIRYPRRCLMEWLGQLPRFRNTEEESVSDRN